MERFGASAKQSAACKNNNQNCRRLPFPALQWLEQKEREREREKTNTHTVSLGQRNGSGAGLWRVGSRSINYTCQVSLPFGHYLLCLSLGAHVATPLVSVTANAAAFQSGTGLSFALLSAQLSGLALADHPVFASVPAFNAAPNSLLTEIHCTVPRANGYPKCA